MHNTIVNLNDQLTVTTNQNMGKILWVKWWVKLICYMYKTKNFYEQMFWQIYLYHNLNIYNEGMETEAKKRELAI